VRLSAGKFARISVVEAKVMVVVSVVESI